MIDNFDSIKELLDFPNDDTFYDLQIIRRGKDHPNLPSANRTIKSYYICKLESLDGLREEITKLCEFFKARAYINVAKRSLRKVSALQIAYIAQRTYEGDYKKIWKSWSTCTGQCKSDDPRWVIDVDRQEDMTEAEFDGLKLKIIAEIHALPPEGDKLLKTIRTKNGVHIITKPFRLDAFKKEFPDIDVHKNNPTVLYIPKSLD